MKTFRDLQTNWKNTFKVGDVVATPFRGQAVLYLVLEVDPPKLFGTNGHVKLQIISHADKDMLGDACWFEIPTAWATKSPLSEIQAYL